MDEKLSFIAECLRGASPAASSGAEAGPHPAYPQAGEEVSGSDRHRFQPMIVGMKRLRAVVPPLEEDRYMAPDIEAAVALVRAGALVEAAGPEEMPGW